MKRIILINMILVQCIFASSFEININNNTVELEIKKSLTQSYELDEDGDYLLTAKFLNHDKDDQKSKLVSVGLEAVNPYIDDNGLIFGIGIQAVWVDNSTKEFMAIPLGLYLCANFSEQVSFEVQGAYAPKVLTMLDGTKYVEAKATLNYRIINNGSVFVGGRVIKTSYKKIDDRDFDNKIFFGFKVRF